jgi:hypothetical protein
MMNAAVVALLLCGASAGRAEESDETGGADELAAVELGPDEVTLRNGGIVRGTVLAVEPGQHVDIQVHGASEPRRIPWAEVADVERGKHAPRADIPETPPAPTPAPQPAEATPPDAREGDMGLVRLRMPSDSEVRLVEHTEVMRTGWFGVTQRRVVCKAPCDELLDARGNKYYQFTGPGMPDSKAFTLSEYRGEVRADIRPGSSALRGGGIALVTLGSVGVGAGVLLTVIGFVDGSPSSPMREFRIAGPTAMGVGSAVAVGGGLMIGFSKTTFDLSEASEETAATDAPPLGGQLVMTRSW